MRGRQRKRSVNPTASATLVQPACVTTKSPASLCPWPADQRPPTSTPAMSNRALPRGPTSSGYIRSFLLAAVTSSPEAPSSGGPVPSKRADDRGVDGKLCTSKQKQPVDCHLERSRVCPVCDLEVEISQQHVGGDSSACLPADTCNIAFQRKTSPAQHPCPCTSCAVMAKYVKVVATPAVARG